MPCQRLLFVALLAAVCGAAAPACGGSASETPPPLEPDPRGFHYAPAQLTPSDSDAGEAPNSHSAEYDDDKSRAKASSTGGDSNATPP